MTMDDVTPLSSCKLLSNLCFVVVAATKLCWISLLSQVFKQWNRILENLEARKVLVNAKKRYQTFFQNDEIHVKPSLEFQKDKVIGFAADIDYPCVAKTVLAIMINPSMGAPAFVARLLPVFSLKTEFLTNQITIVMNVIHEVGGYVFLIMTDNLSVNQKMFKVYHKENPSTCISINQI